MPQSTVISRYRPRLPVVSKGLLSMDRLLIVTIFGFFSPIGQSSHGAPSPGAESSKHSLPAGCHTVGLRSAHVDGVFTKFLTHTANREIYRRATFCTGQRLRYTLCPRVQTLPRVRVPLPPFPTIKARMLFISAIVATARFQKLLLRALWSLSP